MTPQELREARERAGLTLARLAGILGVSHRTVKRWENGETRFGKVEQIAIRHILQSLNDLGRAR